MATINTASSDNLVVRLVMSKSRSMLKYDTKSSGIFVGPAQFSSRVSVSEYTATNPFTFS